MPETSMGIYYPSSADPPNGPAQMQALAAAVDTLLNLPDPVENHISTTIAPTSTSFATLPSPGPLSVSFTNPSTDYDLMVDLEFQAWVAGGGAGATTMQAGIAASGGMTWAANGFTTDGSGPISNGDNIFQGSAQATLVKAGYPVLIPAGASAITFTMHALRSNTSNAVACNYPIIRVKPRRFVVP